MKNNLSVVFLGTPDFAIPTLNMLYEEGYNIKAVITQPDRRTGRGHKMVAPPVKQRAEELDIPVYQYEKVSREGLELIKSLEPDLMITVAFGQILSSALLAVPKYGCINVHGSLLPRLRGAAPIEWSIINGDEYTGISTMYTVRKLDAGDVLLSKKLKIEDSDTGGTLRSKLSVLGAETLKETLELLKEDRLTRTPQNEEEVTYASQFERGFGKIDFGCDTRSIVNLVRGINPEPGAYAMLDENKIKIGFVSAYDYNGNEEPGTIVVSDVKKGLVVKTGNGAVRIERLQYPGSKELGDIDFLRGRAKVVEKGKVFN